MAAPISDDGRGGAQGDRVIEFSMPSRLEILGVLDQLVQAIVAQMEFEEDDANAVANSIIEAGTNAIQHGHHFEATKPVRFRFLLTDQALQVWVHDDGPGFDLKRVLAKDPTGPEGLLNSRGRGIFIMRALMDTVDFDIQPGHGLTVHLVKNLHPSPPSESTEGS